MIKKALVVLSFDAEFYDSEVHVVEEELQRFVEEYYGDEVRLESVTLEKSDE